MNRWKVIAGLTLIFVSGIVIGTVGTGLYVRHQIRTKINAIISGDVQATSEIVVDRLGKALNLSEEQKSNIRPLIEKAVQQVAELRSRLRPQFERVFIQTSEEMKRFLTAEQESKMDRVLARVRRGLSSPEPRKEQGS